MTGKILKYFIIASAIILSSTQAQAYIPKVSHHISNERISAVCQDADGYIWFGTSRGLNRFSGENFLIWNIPSEMEEGALNNDQIYDLCIDDEGSIWIANNSGLNALKNGRFFNKNTSGNNPVHRVLALSDGSILASGKDGIIKFDKNYRFIQSFNRKGLPWAKNIALDSFGHIWIASETNSVINLYVLDLDLNPLKEIVLAKGENIKAINSNPDGSVWIVSNKRLYAFKSASLEAISVNSHIAAAVMPGKLAFIKNFDDYSIIIGIKGQGLELINLTNGEIFRIHETETLSGSDFKIFVDNDKNLWLIETGVGYKYLASENNYTNYAHLLTQLNATVLRNIKSDSKGILWLSLDDGYAAFDPVNRKILWRLNQRKSLTYITVDAQDRIWTISDDYSIRRYKLSPLSRIPVLDKVFDINDNVSSISPDYENNIWLLCNRTIYKIDSNDKLEEIGAIRDENGAMIPHTFALTDPSSMRVYISTVSDGLFEAQENGMFSSVNLSGISSVSTLTSSKDGSVWIGTSNEGLIHYYPNTGRIERRNLSNGLSSNSICSIIEDGLGKIWFSSPTHIVCFNPQTQDYHTIYDYHFSDNNEYNIRSVAYTPQGKLYFGGYGGLSEVDENVQFANEENDLSLRLEYISIDGIQPDELPKSLDISYKQKTISFLYSAINFRYGAVLNYAYMLEGQDKDWNYTEQTQLTITNLPAGKYVLRVKARLMNGEWSKDEISLPITVQYAPWASPLATVAYILFFFAIVFFVVRAYLISRLRNKDLSTKQQHLDFIANISHELRTPLSLIVAPLRQLQKISNLSEKEQFLLDTMDRNTERLRIISEELLEIPSSQTTTEKLRVSNTDISALVNGIASSFRYAAVERNQSIKCEVQKSAFGYVDSQKIEKILFNLIGNAFKYAHEASEIKVGFHTHSNSAIFTVQDDGPGIPEEQRKKIFERFERLGASKSKPEVVGSGIGLNYAMSLANLHKGTLSYRPVVNGVGSIFTLVVPCNEEAYDESEIGYDVAVSKYPSSNNAQSSAAKYDASRPNVLIAEDNAEIAEFISMLLAKDYNVICAPDGTAAWDSLKITIPDLIISDIVMPGKDGITLCRDIKKNAEYCHIPIILLSAKNHIEDTVRGMNLGADAYIGKPFDPDHLTANVRSLIENRKRIQLKIQNLTPKSIEDSDVIRQTQLKESEIAFLNKMHAIIEQNIENEEFSIEYLARELGASYSKLYAKVKSLTGQTPQSFLTTYKMNKAMEMLKSGKYSIAEVSDAIACSSPFNFSRDFKKHFGITPSSVLKSS